MKNVVGMPQRRRSWLSSPFVASLATIAAAVAAVGIGLSLVNRGGFGTGETPTPSASASPSATATPLASVVPGLSPLPAPSADTVGAFGPTWQMNPEEAFQPSTTCENLSGLPTQEVGPGVAYRISMPDDWFNRRWVGDCMLFGPEPFEPTDPPAIPEAAAIWIDVESGGNFAPDGSVISTEEYTVDGVPTIRYEIQPSDALPSVGDPSVESGLNVALRSILGRNERVILWIVGVYGGLPSAASDSPPYLAITTSSGDPTEFAQHVAVLDRMVATLVVLEP